MTTQRLLDVDRPKRERWTGGRAIVLVERERCLRCGGELHELSFGQLPLFRSHGHGAVTETTLLICKTRFCEWTFVARVTEVNPRRYLP
jgi:hypothetical protein